MRLLRPARTTAALLLLALVFTVGWLLWPRTEVEAQPGAPRWSYAVKFVCGFSNTNLGRSDPNPNQVTVNGEATVKRGNYATDINIYNPQDVGLEVFKDVLVLYDDTRIPAPIGREPRQVGVTGADAIGLGPRRATMDDCNRIYELAGITPGLSPPLLIGFLVLNSHDPIQVSAVYTAELCSNTREFSGNCEPRNNNSNFGVGMSIDVEQITGQFINGP